MHNSSDWRIIMRKDDTSFLATGLSFPPSFNRILRKLKWFLMKRILQKASGLFWALILGKAYTWT